MGAEAVSSGVGGSRGMTEGEMASGEGWTATRTEGKGNRTVQLRQAAPGLERSVGHRVLRRPLAGVELVDHVLRDALQHLLGEDAQQLPAQV